MIRPLLFVTLIVSLISCGGSQSSHQNPSSDREKIPPEDKRYRATVHWSQPQFDINGRTLSDLSGFRIHYGTSASKLDQVIMIKNPQLTITNINNLTAGEYYMSIVALTHSGLESAPSEIYSVAVGQ